MMGSITSKRTHIRHDNMAAAAPPKKSAAPGSKDPSGEKKPKEKVKRVDLDLTTVDPQFLKDGKLTQVPPGYDPKKFNPLKKSHFVDEATYFEVQAARFEKQAAAFRAKAEESRKLGGVKDRGKAKRLLQMQKRMAELQASLINELGPEVVAELMKSAEELNKPAAPAVSA